MIIGVTLVKEFRLKHATIIIKDMSKSETY